MGRLGIAGALMLMLVLSLAACGSSSTSSATASGSGDASVAGKSVYIINCTEEVPWCAAYQKDLTAELEQAGIEVTSLDDNFEPDLQDQHMNQAIARHADAVILNAANSSAIVPAVERAEAAGVKVVNTDAPLSGEGADAPVLSVVADHVAMGRFAGEGLVEGLEKEGKKSGNVIVAAGALATTSAQERLAGFEGFMKKYPQYKIVAVDDTSWDQNKATQIASQRLAQYRSEGGIQGAYGMNDLLALGVIKAAEQAGVPVGVEKGGLVVVGGNCLAPGIPAVKDGTLFTSGTQTPGPEAEAVAKHTIALLEGKSQPKTVTIKEYKITKANVKEFEQQCTF